MENDKNFKITLERDKKIKSITNSCLDFVVVFNDKNFTIIFDKEKVDDEHVEKLKNKLEFFLLTEANIEVRDNTISDKYYEKEINIKYL